MSQAAKLVGMPPDERYRFVSLILAVAGGFADAGSYVLSASFTGHLVLTAVNLVRANWGGALSCALATLAFLAGSAGGLRWRRVPGRSPSRHMTPLLIIEMLLIALGMALGPADRDLFLVCVCLAMGVQNGAAGKVASVSFHTTFMTGLTTSLLGPVVAGEPSPKRQVLPAILVCFVAGAGAGALLAAHFGTLSFAALLALLSAALAIAARGD